MTLITLSVTFGFMLIGYLIGSFSNATFVTKIYKLGDIREKGSGNAGATNILRIHGFKMGIVVFVLDFMKTIVSILIALPLREHVLLPMIGIAVVMGHIWPLFYSFRGGKGSATLFGLFLAINWMITLIGIILFFIIIYIKKMVSLGSIIAPLILIIIFIIVTVTGTSLSESWAMPLTYDVAWSVSALALTISYLLTVLKHRDNIRRIIKGKERKIGSTKL